MTSNTPQRCPICSTEVESHPRYPRYVCRDCARRVRSADGRPLEFFNRDLSGGFAARYADTGAPYRSHECLIDGVECYADEARLGGIVIQTQRPSGASHDRNVRKPVSATYQSLARAHLANYKRRTLGVSEDGPWLKTGKVYPHISPWRLRKLNILPSIRAEFFAHPVVRNSTYTVTSIISTRPKP